MTAGGKRPGAGRPAGARNRRTVATVTAIEASGLTPLDYMLSVMQNTEVDSTTRLDAAKAAAPFCHARLSSNEVTIMQPGDELTQEELEAKIASALHASPDLLARLLPH